MIAACAAALFANSSIGSAASGTRPSVVKYNDANHDGVFSDTENAPKDVTYPLVVTYRLTIDAGTFGSHTITSIADDMTSTLLSQSYSPSCAALVGTTIDAGKSKVCYYDVSLSGAGTAPLLNTATIRWDRNGPFDTASNTSTVNFPAVSLHKSSSTTLVSSLSQLVPYTYVVTNTGTVAVTGIAVADDNTDGAPSCPQSSLAPGSSMSCTAGHTVSQSELDAGSVDNTAVVTSNEAADRMDTLHIPVAVFPVGGTFVVGDLTVGSLSQATGKTVMFWGAQWQKQNQLSAGGAPSAFKGFEDSLASPVCGTSWTSRPGNSTPPPATTPAYMAVIVSSAITKSGSTIAGDTLHIVIVKTDPGYEGNPGHAGTGTIVGVVC
jgi:hypothetical protein